SLSTSEARRQQWSFWRNSRIAHDSSSKQRIRTFRSRLPQFLPSAFAYSRHFFQRLPQHGREEHGDPEKIKRIIKEIAFTLIRNEFQQPRRSVNHSGYIALLVLFFQFISSLDEGKDSEDYSPARQGCPSALC
ncbi:undecaprenyl-phosphate4-deoxy-4-formamido-L-arabinose transferase, partial [Striga asiatica]